MILSIWMHRHILLDARTTYFLDFFECREIDPIRIIDIAVRVRAGHNLCTEFLRLLDCICSNIAGAGDDNRFACEINTFCIKHILDEVEKAIARCFGTCKAAPIVNALARQNTRIIGVTDALILPEQIADLTPADTDIAGRNIQVRPNVTIELRHKALAELHDLIVGASMWIEIRSSLGTADGQSCQGVLIDLLESKEFQNIE